jgi:putative sterol carrier protein
MLPVLRASGRPFAPHAPVANLPSFPVTLSLSDEDFGKLVAGKANAQRLFMSGKLKVKGDVMKATKLEPVLARSRTKAKL